MLKHNCFLLRGILVDNHVHFNRGLTNEEVKSRIDKGLVNGEYEIKTKSIKSIILENILSLFNLINTVLVVCILLVHSYKNMLFYGVVIWNVFIGIAQEIRAKRVIDKLSILSTPKAKVLRNGEIEEIEMKDIVIDDLLVLVSGNQISVDCVIVEGECEVNESLITGESTPIYREVGEELLSGSYILSGNIKATAKRLGKDNYVNKITQGAKYVKKPNSEIMRSIKQIIKIISIALIPISIILCYKQIFVVDQNFNTAVVRIVAAISGMIPGGLVLLTSIVLAVGVIRLAKHNTLSQDLYCIETLARVDMLCLDKTGTITQGSMQIEDVILFDEKDAADFEFGINAYTYALSDNNPTFHAIKERYHEAITHTPSITIPFSSHNKWSLASYDTIGSFILGAPEFVLKDNYKHVKEKIEEYAKDGRRILLFACSKNMPRERALPEQIEPLAMLVISDTIRENVNETLEFFEKQGVTIKVISGDNPIAVSYIAKKAGIKEAQNYIDASVLETKEQIYEAASKYTVFGRVSPYQKLELVKALKEMGHTVAMTGDGVNDVLALKEADCSIAMQNGSDAARNTSQLVLLDSNFASMPHIVAEGKRSINNLQRSATLYLVKTIYVSMLSLLFVFVSIPYPFAPIQMTLIGALSIGIPSFILALEANHKRIKEHFVKNVLKLAIPGGVLVVSNIILAIFFAYQMSASDGQIATIATLSTFITSIIVLFNLCRPLNLLRGSLLTCIGVCFILAVTFFGEFFNIIPLNTSMYLAILILGIISFLLHRGLIRLINTLFRITIKKKNRQKPT